MQKLEAKGIFCGYDSKLVLNNVSFSAQKGEFIAVLGQNGCGKTTLLKTLLNILPLQGGSIMMDGTDLNRINRKEIAKQISYVPQISRPIEGFSVKEAVLMGRTPYLGLFSDISRSDIDAADQAIERTKLAGLHDRDVSSLSGGEYQRVLIARAITQGADILLLDEPTSHLDIKFQIETAEILRSLSDKLIISTFHQLQLAREFCGRVILIKDGMICCDGAAKDILSSNNIEKTFDIDSKYLTLFG